MKTTVTILLFFISFQLCSAQYRFGSRNEVSVIEMESHEFLKFDENASRFFWAVDLNIFSENQKSTFQELVFSADHLVAVSTPDENNFWYLASYKNVDENLIRVELNKMIEKSKTLSVTPADKYK